MESNWRSIPGDIGFSDWEIVPPNPTRRPVLAAKLVTPLFPGTLDLRWVFKLNQINPSFPVLGCYGSGISADYCDGLYGAFVPTTSFPYGNVVFPDS